MDYTLSKNFNIQLQSANKMFFFDFFQSSLESIKKSLPHCPYTSLRIALRTSDNCSCAFDSLQDYKDKFYSSSEIEYCEFTVLLYENQNMYPIDVILTFTFSKNISEVMLFQNLRVTATSQVAANDCLAEIEKQLPFMLRISDEVIKPIPVEITTSSNERKHQEISSKLDQHVTLKHTILVTIIGCTLTFILGYALALLT